MFELGYGVRPVGERRPRRYRRRSIGQGHPRDQAWQWQLRRTRGQCLADPISWRPADPWGHPRLLHLVRQLVRQFGDLDPCRFRQQHRRVALLQHQHHLFQRLQYPRHQRGFLRRLHHRQLQPGHVAQRLRGSGSSEQRHLQRPAPDGHKRCLLRADLRRRE